eukprot:scaffold1535_cov382-Prasinococcus_capsulatus_cf.AAC.18
MRRRWPASIVLDCFQIQTLFSRSPRLARLTPSPYALLPQPGAATAHVLGPQGSSGQQPAQAALPVCRTCAFPRARAKQLHPPRPPARCSGCQSLRLATKPLPRGGAGMALAIRVYVYSIPRHTQEALGGATLQGPTTSCHLDLPPCCKGCTRGRGWLAACDLPWLMRLCAAIIFPALGPVVPLASTLGV